MSGRTMPHWRKPTWRAVQPANAVLETLPALLLRPGVLPGLDFATGVKVADLLAYFAGGHVETVT